LAQGYAGRIGLPAGVCRRYLRDLRYNLTEDDLAGLKLFLELALDGFKWESLEFWGETLPTVKDGKGKSPHSIRCLYPYAGNNRMEWRSAGK
jgi:hypothetical protein